MIYVSVREPREKALSYAREKKLPYPVLLDEDVAVAKSLGVSGIPAHFILDLEGKVRFRNTGRIKEHEEVLDRLIQEMQKKKKVG